MGTGLKFTAGPWRNCWCQHKIIGFFGSCALPLSSRGDLAGRDLPDYFENWSVAHTRFSGGLEKYPLTKPMTPITNMP